MFMISITSISSYLPSRATSKFLGWRIFSPERKKTRQKCKKDGLYKEDKRGILENDHWRMKYIFAIFSYIETTTNLQQYPTKKLTANCGENKILPLV